MFVRTKSMKATANFFAESKLMMLVEAYYKMVAKAIHLKLDEQRKTGVLFTRQKSANVRVMKINTKGDALVHDGKSVLMIPSKHVYSQDMEKTLGVKRLALTKRAFKSITKGDLNDVMSIYKELLPLLI